VVREFESPSPHQFSSVFHFLYFLLGVPLSLITSTSYHYLIIMSSCNANLSSLFNDIGLVVFKFDPTFGPLVVLNHSFLSDDEISKLAIKGISTLMAGINYSSINTRRFRGIFQIADGLYAYCFDILTLDVDSDSENSIPIIFFVVFTDGAMPLIGSNLLVIEEHLSSLTSNLYLSSQITPEFGFNMLLSLKNVLI